MKFSELKGRAVVNLEGASKIGEVDNLLLDLDNRKVASIKAKSGLFGTPHYVPADQVKGVGSDAVTFMGEASPNNPAEPAPPPEGSLPVQPTTRLTELTEMINDKVVTDAGQLVGQVHDVMFDPSSMTITGFEVRGGGLFGQITTVSATPEVHYGERLITVPAQLVERVE